MKEWREQVKRAAAARTARKRFNSHDMTKYILRHTHAHSTCRISIDRPASAFTPTRSQLAPRR